jgi:hypothetical protein
VLELPLGLLELPQAKLASAARLMRRRERLRLREERSDVCARHEMDGYGDSSFFEFDKTQADSPRDASQCRASCL